MFNETTSGLGEVDCAGVKSFCDEYLRNGDTPEAQHAAYVCMENAGYFKTGNGCFESSGYDNPGATTYPLDVVTNPDNPHYVLPNLGLGNWNTLAIVALAIGAVFFLKR